MLLSICARVAFYLLQRRCCAGTKLVVWLWTVISLRGWIVRLMEQRVSMDVYSGNYPSLTWMHDEHGDYLYWREHAEVVAQVYGVAPPLPLQRWDLCSMSALS